MLVAAVSKPPKKKTHTCAAIMFSSKTANGKTRHICTSQDRKMDKMQNMKEEEEKEKGRGRKKI
jgi:hypothetical protein